MIFTAIGLPNTCSRCGERCTGQWWAEHEDAARSGAGLCDECESTRLRRACLEYSPPGEIARPESVGEQPVAPAAPVHYEPVGETLTRVQPSSAKRSKIK